MEKRLKEGSHIHKLTFAELLGTIDHKVRGIQQLIIALRELTEDKSLIDSLDQMMKGLREIQEMYNNFLNIRRIEEENVRTEEFFMTELNLSSTCRGIIRIDVEKLKFIYDTIRNFGGEDCENSSYSTGKGCIVKFSSNVFSGINNDELKSIPQRIILLPLFAVRKITEKMDGTFNIADNEIIIEFPYIQE